MKPVIEFNVENFLTPISFDSPCGESLEDSLEFAQLENAAKFIGERQMGETIIPEVPPDWKKVRDLAIGLLMRSRDIQIAMHLTCALLSTEGFAGLLKGLSLLKGLLENYWDDVYPRQEPGDDQPILRFNTLNTLNDPKKILNPIAQIKLTQSKAGEFSWRAIRSAQGNSVGSASNVNAPDPKFIDAAFIDTALPSLKQEQQEAKQALELSQSIASLLTEKSNSSQTPNLSGLISLLKDINKFLTDKVLQRDTLEIGTPITTNDLQSPEKAGVAGKKDGINDRDDVIRTLDDICKYFERNEPSSPIPFLMQRAKKLLTMNFMDILRDMAPDAVNQAEKICGNYKKDKN
jgi:type VI secretion system protein ImpA